MKDVFLVYEGDYEDVSVVAVCSTLKKAKYAQRLFLGNSIITRKIDELPEHPKGLVRWAVFMDVEGNAARIDQISINSGEEWEPEYSDPPKNVQFRVWAKDEKGAVKEANKKRKQLVAEMLWTTDYDTWINRQLFSEAQVK